MPDDWLSHIYTKPDGTWCVAFNGITFETAARMLKTYVAHTLAERGHDDLKFPDEGLAG